jgi:hypothetical protein
MLIIMAALNSITQNACYEDLINLKITSSFLKKIVQYGPDAI